MLICGSVIFLSTISLTRSSPRMDTTAHIIYKKTPFRVFRVVRTRRPHKWSIHFFYGSFLWHKWSTISCSCILQSIVFNPSFVYFVLIIFCSCGSFPQAPDATRKCYNPIRKYFAWLRKKDFYGRKHPFSPIFRK